MKEGRLSELAVEACRVCVDAEMLIYGTSLGRRLYMGSVLVHSDDS